MKKFFGIGLLALLTTAYLTSSCSRDEFSGSLLEAKAEAFKNAFKEVYGDPDPQHNWGFGDDATTRAFTRAAEPRANEWAATYKVPAPLTDGQKNRVMKYFQYNNTPGGTTMNYTNYFVQQVYKGGTKPLGNGTNGYSPETYLAANQETYITGGGNMDKLTAGTQHEHVNNFNYGDCGWNYNVLGNDGTTHSDQIMLMLNTPTTCMGYWNSNASFGHDDRYRLVSAATIDQWASNNADKLDPVDAAVVDGWNRDFVGFDFSQVPSDKILVKTNERWENNVLVDYDLVYATIDDGPKTYDYIWDGTQTIKITDENRAQYLYLKNALGQRIPFLSNLRNEYCGSERKKDKGDFSESAQYVAGAANNSSIEISGVPYTRTLDNGGTQTENVGPALNLKFINKMIADGYYPIQENFRTWISPRDCADGYYSDWIVSLVHAQTKDGGDVPSENYDMISVQRIIDGRIFCEDLGSSDHSDIDYNDVVFDAFTYMTDTYKVPYTLDSDNNKVYDLARKVWQSSVYNKTDINLLAAGGTIDIAVAQQNVNTLLGIEKTIMANTYVEGKSPNQSGYSNVRDGVSPYKFTIDNSAFEDLSAIPIVVKQGQNVRELTAYEGDVPQKFRAPVGTPWPVERKAIEYGLPDFKTWVGNRNVTPWYNLGDEFLYHLKFASSNGPQIGGSISGWENKITNGAIKISGKGKKSGEEDFITINLDQPLEIGDQIAITAYRNKESNAIGSLYFKFENGFVIEDTQVYNNIAYNMIDFETKPNTFVWTVTSDMAGCSSFQLSRNLTGTNVYITSFTIIGGLGAQRDETTSGGSTPVTPVIPGDQGEEEETDPTVSSVTGTDLNIDPTTLTPNSSLTLPAASFNNVSAATVYIYGTGDGEVLVNGVSATTESSAPRFGFTRSATPVVKVCQLGPSNLKTNRVVVSGYNFRVVKCSMVNQTGNYSVSEPTGKGDIIYNTSTILDWGDNGGAVTITNDALKSVQVGSKIRVFGIGYASSYWEVQAFGFNTTGGWNQSTQLSPQDGTSFSGNGAKEIVFPITTQAQANMVKGGRIVVQGYNFILKYVTVENPSSGGDGDIPGTAVWSINSYSGQNQKIESSDLQVLDTSKAAHLVIYGRHTSNWWEIQVLHDWTKILTARSDNSYASCGHWENSNINVPSDGVIIIPLKASEVALLKQDGMRVYLGEVTVSKMELRQ